MADHWQELVVFIVVVLAAILLLRGALARRRGCESCPIHEISRHRQNRGEPKKPSVVEQEAGSALVEDDDLNGDK